MLNIVLLIFWIDAFIDVIELLIVVIIGAEREVITDTFVMHALVIDAFVIQTFTQEAELPLITAYSVLETFDNDVFIDAMLPLIVLIIGAEREVITLQKHLFCIP